MTGAVGTSKDITVTVTPDGAPQDITVASDNEQIATVTKKSAGTYIVTIAGEGSADITFTAGTVSAALAVTATAAQ